MSRFAAVSGLLVLATTLATSASTPPPAPIDHAERDRGLIEQALGALPRQRPGIVDMYAIGFAGDGSENVFRNEVEYFVRMARQRLNVRGTVALVSHPASLSRRPLPLASYANLRLALNGLGRVVDPREDVLLLYMTMHGTPEHELVLYFPPLVDEVLTPEDMTLLLDESGIRHRVVVVSACYAGGFLPALRRDDTMAIAAARADRPSFGCGTASHVTWFGRGWMLEGLSRDTDFSNAFEHAKDWVSEWEQEQDVEPSEPQIAVGDGIARQLATWRSQTPAGPPLDYPLPLE